MAGLKGKVSAQALYKFKKNVENLNKRQRVVWMESASKALAKNLVGNVVPDTPRDTGNLRRGWTVSETRRVGDTYEIDVFNPVEYAPYVEFGHRLPNNAGWVEGRFMLSRAEMKLRADAPRILVNRLNKLIREGFKV
jgi:hypothetical protein